MTKAGRNDPCPCGSGKKYKRCCGAANSAPGLETDQPSLAIHRADDQVVDEVLRWARKRFGKAWGGEAYEVYRNDAELDDVETQLLVPWSVYGFEVDGKTPAAHFLEERGHRLTEKTRDWLKAQLAAWLSIWEVLEVQPGVGVRVRDLLTHEERFVHEVSGSKTLGLRDAILARVVDYGGVSTFCGIHPRLLPPGVAEFVVQQGRRFCRVRTKPVSKDKLRGMAAQFRLIHSWRLAVEEYDRPRPMPKLQNTDGDPLLLTRDHFDFDAQVCGQVVTELRKLEGAQEPEEQDADEVSITFQKEGNAQFKSWDNTVVGRAIVAAGRLTLETNSIRRADALRRRVEAGVSDFLRYRVREHSDMEALLKEQRAKPSKGEAELDDFNNSPQAKAILREFKEKHMASWVDEKIPALGGLTPREAAAKPAARSRLDLLLRGMENHERGLPVAERFDYGRLRKDLRLPL